MVFLYLDVGSVSQILITLINKGPSSLRVSRRLGSIGILVKAEKKHQVCFLQWEALIDPWSRLTNADVVAKLDTFVLAECVCGLCSHFRTQIFPIWLIASLLKGEPPFSQSYLQPPGKMTRNGTERALLPTVAACVAAETQNTLSI